jgi:acyl-CoA thioester hydrolase
MGGFMLRRKAGSYFKKIKGEPPAVVVLLKRRASFSEVDAMGIVWYGRFAAYFEEGAAALGRLCGLTYRDFYKARLLAPIAQFHIDYHRPIVLDEEFIIESSLTWSQGSRINIEHRIIKKNASLAASGYTVQMLVDARTRQVCLVSPALLLRCRKKWKKGEFKCQK